MGNKELLKAILDKIKKDKREETTSTGEKGK